MFSVLRDNKVYLPENAERVSMLYGMEEVNLIIGIPTRRLHIYIYMAPCSYL